MGTSKAALELILQAKDDASKVVKGFSGNLGSLGSVAATAATGGMAAMAVGAAAVGTAALAASAAVLDFSYDTAGAMRLVQAQLGASSDAMLDMRQQSMDVFESGWGESVGDIADAMARVNQTLDEQGDELEDSTRRALILRDVFAIDVEEGIGIAATAVKSDLVDSSKEAFDLITTGFQMGLNQAGDFGDTIREYASDFSRMGFSADEMLNILNAGLEEGAYNTDVIGDGIREFNIRLQEGGDVARQSLNILFDGLMGDTAAVTDMQREMDRANQTIKSQEQALEANAIALEENKGLYAASADQVNELETQLSAAQRQLRDMAAPNLEGMGEMEDQIFDVEMAIKQARLALLGLPEDTAEYDVAQARVDDLNKQMDRLQLERDITFDRQLRDIEKAATDGTEIAVTYAEALASIAEKKQDIGGLSDELAQARMVMRDNGAAVESLKDIQDQLGDSLESSKLNAVALEEALVGLDTPASEFLQQLSSGAMTGKDALALVTEQLSLIADPLERNRLGVELFGSKWEDIGGDVFIAAGQAQGSIEMLAGATDAAGETLNNGLGASIERLKRTALTNLAPLGDVVIDALGKAQPFIDQATLWLGEKLPVGVEWLKNKWDGFFPQARDTVLNFWSGIKPGLVWIEYWFYKFSRGILPHFAEGWETMKVGWALVKKVLRDELIPALETLRESLGLNADDTGELMEKIGNFAGTIAVTGIKALILGISLAVGYVSDEMKRASAWIDAFKQGLEGIRNVADWVSVRINNLQHSLSRLSIPDWLTPGSPTPFELGLRGIGDALGRLPDLDAQFNVGAGGAPMAAAAGGAGVTQLSAIFGPGSVRSDDDIEEIMNRIQELLNIRGLRTWEV